MRARAPRANLSRSARRDYRKSWCSRVHTAVARGLTFDWQRHFLGSTMGGHREKPPFPPYHSHLRLFRRLSRGGRQGHRRKIPALPRRRLHIAPRHIPLLLRRPMKGATLDFTVSDPGRFVFRYDLQGGWLESASPWLFLEPPAKSSFLAAISKRVLPPALSLTLKYRDWVISNIVFRNRNQIAYEAGNHAALLFSLHRVLSIDACRR